MQNFYGKSSLFTFWKSCRFSHLFIDFSHYPDILVCRSPAIDENLAEMYGYPVAYYWQGRTGNWSSGRFVGWNGVSGTLNFTDITDIVGKTRRYCSYVCAIFQADCANSLLRYVQNMLWTLVLASLALALILFLVLHSYCNMNSAKSRVIWHVAYTSSLLAFVLVLTPQVI